MFSRLLHPGAADQIIEPHCITILGEKDQARGRWDKEEEVLVALHGTMLG